MKTEYEIGQTKNKGNIAIQWIGFGNMAKGVAGSLQSYLEEQKNQKVSCHVLTKSGFQIDESLNTATIKYEAGINPDADIIMLCVKPQQLADIDLTVYNTQATLVSILAGVTIDKLETIKRFESIVRLMPNMFVKTGHGVTGMISNHAGEYEEFIESMLKSKGAVMKLDKEEQMHDLTAAFGSGPAYIPFFCELLKSSMKNDLNLGLSEEKLDKMVDDLLLGTVLYRQQTGVSNMELAQSIMSKGGCTQAFRETIQKEGMEEIIRKGLQANRQRSIELGEES